MSRSHVEAAPNKINSSVTTDATLLEYPLQNQGHPKGFEGHPKGFEGNPKALSLSQFHVLLLFLDSVRVICTVNGQLVHEEQHSVSKYGSLLALSTDVTTGHSWVCTNKHVFRCSYISEDRNIWKIFLGKGMFDEALLYCNDDPEHINEVVIKEAEHFFNKGDYKRSANSYANTQNLFGETALKFLQVDDGNESLRLFLEKKMDKLCLEDKAQTTMLLVWLVELYMNRLVRLKELHGEDSEQYGRVLRDFKSMVKQPKVAPFLGKCSETIYDIINSHGNTSIYVFFATEMKDVSRVVSHHVGNDDPSDALVFLRKFGNAAHYVQFSAVLMEQIPKQTVDAWIKLGTKLHPKDLIPALVQYERIAASMNMPNEAIRYLEFCITNLGCRDGAIHNYLLSLYAKYSNSNLMKYLRTESNNYHYDDKYALRLCTQYNRKEACVFLYSLMCLHEEAVELALTFDIELAKLSASRPANDDVELQRKLWLRIARHVVEKESNVENAMEFLHECGNLVKIEDILPFFDSFTNIDHFKDAICRSLQEYNQHIDDLKDEMNTATVTARKIRLDVKELRNRYLVVKATDKCMTCGYNLLNRQFYMFPCQHGFHSDCLLTEMKPNVSLVRMNRIQELQLLIASDRQSETSSLNSSSMGRSGDALQEELDDMLASECLHCGEIMIMSVDKPFFPADSYEAVQRDWI